VTAAPFALRFLSRTDVFAAGGGDFAAAIADVRAALTGLRNGEAEMPAENSVRLGPAGATQARGYALPARCGDVAGVKWTAHRPPLADGLPTITALTVVTDALTGLPLGIVESALLTSMRTAAVSALVLAGAGRNARRVALVGAGVQARMHLRLLREMFPGLDAVTVWNRDVARAEALARMEAPWRLDAVAELDAALEQADAVITCTAAAAPLLGPEAMRPGRLVMQIGYHEVSFEAIDRADAVLVDLWGEFRLTSAKSLFQMHRAGRFPAERVTADLAALVLDGWVPPARACVYFSSFGLNVFDIALAARVLRDAAAGGIGTLLPLMGAMDGAWPEGG
jgi:ornithine cyclodeaminase